GFARGENDRARVPTVRRQPLLQRTEVVCGNILVGDDGASGCAKARLYQIGGSRQQSSADQHVVGAFAEPNANRDGLARRPLMPRGWAGGWKGGHGADASRLPEGSGLSARTSMISPTITSWGTSRLSTIMSEAA